VVATIGPACRSPQVLKFLKSKEMFTSGAGLKNLIKKKRWNQKKRHVSSLATAVTQISSALSMDLCTGRFAGVGGGGCPLPAEVFQWKVQLHAIGALFLLLGTCFCHQVVYSASHGRNIFHRIRFPPAQLAPNTSHRRHSR
jgi:hypothetical protein